MSSPRRGRFARRVNATSYSLRRAKSLPLMRAALGRARSDRARRTVVEAGVRGSPPIDKPAFRKAVQPMLDRHLRDPEVRRLYDARCVIRRECCGGTRRTDEAARSERLTHVRGPLRSVGAAALATACAALVALAVVEVWQVVARYVLDRWRLDRARGIAVAQGHR